MSMLVESPEMLHGAQGRHRVSATQTASYVGAALALGFLLAMLGLFLLQSAPIWQREGLRYLTEGIWFYRAEKFGALAMIYGTAVVSVLALVLAAPLAIGAAVFLSEFVAERARMPLKMTVEMLAAVPSVVYGLLGVLFLRSYVYVLLSALGLDPLSGDTLFTAAALLALMILPTLVTLADDALRAIPAAQRSAARALGLTHSETVLSVCLPQARSGLIAACMLALGRAIGETIAVFLVVGRQDNQLPQSWLPLDSLINAGQTLTSKLGGAETNIAYGSPLHWSAMVGLGLILLAIVLAVTLAGAALQRRG